MFIGLILLALLALALVVSRHGPSVYDDLPDHWGPESFWNRVPRA